MVDRNSYWGSIGRSQRAGRAIARSNRGEIKALDVSKNGEAKGSIFEDPRKTKERRVDMLPEQIPDTGCRRKTERRSERIRLGFWWMKRQYGKDNTAR